MNKLLNWLGWYEWFLVRSIEEGSNLAGEYLEGYSLWPTFELAKKKQDQLYNKHGEWGYDSAIEPIWIMRKP